MRWVKEMEYLEDSMANKTHIRGRKYVKDGEVARKKRKPCWNGEKSWLRIKGDLTVAVL